MSKKRFGLFAGAALGVGLGMLFAPKKGSETREDLKNKMNDLLKQAKEVDIDDVKKYVEKQIKNIQSELEDLDKEKVLELAKEKGEDIKKKVSELKDYVEEKGTPVLEKAVDDVKASTIKVLKSTIKKIETAENPLKKPTKKTSKK